MMRTINSARRKDAKRYELFNLNIKWGGRNMSEERFEVIVIGGGLAGLSAAYRLSKAGRKVLVLE